MTSEPFAAQPVSGVGGGRIVGMEEGQKDWPEVPQTWFPDRVRQLPSRYEATFDAAFHGPVGFPITPFGAEVLLSQSRPNPTHPDA